MFSARVILDSIGPNNVRLTTFEVTIPRIVLAEFNTHRMFSRNSASSRAIPVEKMLKRVQDDPFIPSYWGKNQKGMQAEEELSPEAQDIARRKWRGAKENARISAEELLEIGVHKQLTNRLIEPFMWHTIVFTATELENFYALRANKMAQPEIRIPAEMLIAAFEESTPMRLEAGEWHLPFVTNYDLRRLATGTWAWEGVAPLEPAKVDWPFWCKVSAARCARVSYLTHEGKRDLSADIARHDDLVSNGHMSPLEHPAMALTTKQWKALANAMAVEWIERRVPVGNFWGWHQYRKTIENEHNFRLIAKEKA